MEHSKLNRIVAGSVFLISLMTYIKTLSDTVVFWDVGEFISASYYLQVPHPPGSPLFLLVGRIFGLIPFAADLAVRVHFTSALSSALTAMFLYLSIEKLIVLWRGIPETTSDKLAFFGASVVGALSLTFSPTFWFNAVEAEVYGASMLFIGLITYLSLRWNERADDPGADKYIMLIAYLIGLSLGVHLLALLVFFPFAIIYYFKKYEFSFKGYMIFGAIAVAIFLVIYPGIVKMIPNLLDGEVMLGEEANRSFIWTLIPIAVVAAAIYGIYYSYIHKKELLNLACLSFVLIVLGYSTYAMVIIRSNARPPMNENNPDTLGRLVSYLNREQYGDAPILKRRYSQEPQHQGIYTKYTSDSDFFWRYQIDHMMVRYFLWQYAGSEGDWQDAGVNWKELWGIPLFIGLFGMYYHFKQDRKMWWVFFNFFLLMGVVLAVYFNMQEPQPRERDYFFVGAFFVFSIWIGIGVVGLIDTVKSFMKNAQAQKIAMGGMLALCVAFVPVNMLRTNFKTANRTGDYVAWDYSYNLLQSCEPDAILFTNGDNDTFPLWYLQDVEGVRRDIRIVNLSLVNTSWYIEQLKNETPWGAKKVPISTPDEEIARIQPMQWEPREMELPVPASVINQYRFLSDINSQGVVFPDSGKGTGGTIKFTMPYTMTFGSIKAIRVQDIVTYDIIMTNKWERPIYFAVTSTPDSKLGLEKYFRMDGLAMKMVPFKTQSDEGLIVDSILSANLYNTPKVPAKTFQRGYLFRNLNNPSVYYDENVTRLVSNYRNSFLRLALHHLNETKNFQKATAALDSMESKVPSSVIPMDYRVMYDVANFYHFAGAQQKYADYTQKIERQILEMIQKGVSEPFSQYNPYYILYTVYQTKNEYDKATDVLNQIKVHYASLAGIDQWVESQKQQVAAQKALASAAPASKDTTKPNVKR
ncbi:MAG TPA: DUF2723 domain-containing protein [Bacteroidota bacterium]|nr:DUF2723 domain-containing protein [Bacteroidota bacterium]